MDAVDLTRAELHITATALATSEAILQEAGREGVECLILLAGRPQSDALVLDRVYLPRQRASPISVRLLPGSLIPIHRELATDGYLIAVQIHTHPGPAGHSHTDDADTTVTQLGSLSIVVPDFAEGGLAGWPGCVAYRLHDDGWSEPFDPNDAVTVTP